MIFFLLLYYDVKADDVLKINTIEFTGNKVLSDDYLAARVGIALNEKINYDKVYEALFKLLEEYKEFGLYNARIDSVNILKISETAVDLKIYINEKERIKIIGVDFLGNSIFNDEELEDIFGISKEDYFIEQDIEIGIERIIQLYEKNGNPFCRVEFDTTNIKDFQKTDGIFLKLNIDEGSVVKVDTIAVEGNDFTKENLIIRESGLKEGECFNQSSLNDVFRRINRLGFIGLEGKPELVTFKNSKNGILLKIKEKSSNYFSGILGYLPSGKKNSKGQINGFIDILLGNLFGTGRSMAIKWENRGGFSQDFNFKYSEPYLLNLPVTLSTSFDQSVEDSTYLKKGFSAEFKTQLFHNISGFFSFGYENTIPEQFGRLAYNIKDSKNLYSKIGFEYDSRDDMLNPRRGVYYSTFYSVGKRKSSEIDTKLKENIDRKISIDFQVSIPTKKRGSIYLRIYGAQVSSSKGDIPYNQLFMLGGAHSLRGYKERQFRGSAVALANLEYRFLLGEKSRIFFFYDGGYIDKNESKLFKSGYGWGLRISSKVGIVGFDYGIGEGDSIANGKIHFGVQSNF